MDFVVTYRMKSVQKNCARKKVLENTNLTTFENIEAKNAEIGEEKANEESNLVMMRTF